LPARKEGGKTPQRSRRFAVASHRDQHRGEDWERGGGRGERERERPKGKKGGGKKKGSLATRNQLGLNLLLAQRGMRGKRGGPAKREQGRSTRSCGPLPENSRPMPRKGGRSLKGGGEDMLLFSRRAERRREQQERGRGGKRS